jgi:hypothetical protein
MRHAAVVVVTLLFCISLVSAERETEVRGERKKVKEPPILCL